MDEDDDGEVDQLEFLKMYLVKLGKVAPPLPSSVIHFIRVAPRLGARVAIQHCVLV